MITPEAEIDPYQDLATGPLYPFSEWLNARMPQVATGVYTIWRGTDFIYVGMSGRGMTEERARARAENGSRKGLADRLNSHASGRRSGDQFCVYVADRLVLPIVAPDAPNDDPTPSAAVVKRKLRRR